MRACLDLWERRAPFGIYNVTNPGFVTTRQVIGLIEQILKPARTFEFWAERRGVLSRRGQDAALQLRPGCLQTARRRREDAPGRTRRFEDSLRNWKPENVTSQLDNHEPAYHRRRRLHRLEPDPSRHRPAGDRAAGQPRLPDLRRPPGQPGRRRTPSEIRLRESRPAGQGRRAASRASSTPSPTSCTWPRNRTWTAPSPAPAISSTPTSSARSTCSKPAAPPG